MAKARPTITKRLREKARQERRERKSERRLQRGEERADRPEAVDGEDPDLAGIVAGPQPIPEWMREDDEEAGE